MEKLLTINEVATLLGVSYQRVQQIIREGDLEVVRVGKNGRFVRVRESAFRRCEEMRSRPQEVAV